MTEVAKSVPNSTGSLSLPLWGAGTLPSEAYSSRESGRALDGLKRATDPQGDMRTPLLLFLAASAAAATIPRESHREDPEWVLETPAPVDNGVLGPLEGWEQHECAACHREVTQEWASSLHALAWVDEHYQKDMKKVRRKKSCYGCHIPEPLHGFAGFIPNPDPRDEHRVHGIDCAACHEGEDGQMLGPWGAHTDAHPSEKNKSFTSEGANRLCIACHATNIGPVIGVAKGFNETQVAKDGGSCVGCHMAIVERSHAMDPETGEASPVRVGRSHLLQTPRDPAFLRQAFGIKAHLRGGKVILSIENRTGHRVPGLAQRTLALRFKLLSEDGGTLEEIRHTIDKRRYLPVDVALELEFEEVGEAVLAEGDHDAPGFPEPVRFLDETFPVQHEGD